MQLHVLSGPCVVLGNTRHKPPPALEIEGAPGVLWGNPAQEEQHVARVVQDTIKIMRDPLQAANCVS
jgi:hypothetical protein